MTLDLRHRFVFALVAAAALSVSGCSAADPAPPTSADSSAETPAESGEVDAGEPTLPADFPEDIFVPDGELLSAEGDASGWRIVKAIQHADQARVAMDWNEKSYNFTIDEFVDGDSPSWRMSNDEYELTADVVDGDPVQATFVIVKR